VDKLPPAQAPKKEESKRQVKSRPAALTGRAASAPAQVDVQRVRPAAPPGRAASAPAPVDVQRVW
jgi:hypothetical protein